ncbi:MAG: hypothetical protein ACI90V_005504 [Bacillariaceae sp.]|jgi:hypothetical protein
MIESKNCNRLQCTCTSIAVQRKRVGILVYKSDLLLCIPRTEQTKQNEIYRVESTV